MKNFTQPGKLITIVAGGAVASGSFQVVGSMFGVAATAASGSGKEYELHIGGVVELAKTSAQSWSVGDAVYWDGSVATKTHNSGANLLIGVAVKAAANPSGFGQVRLNDNFGLASIVAMQAGDA